MCNRQNFVHQQRHVATEVSDWLHDHPMFTIGVYCLPPVAAAAAAAAAELPE